MVLEVIEQVAGMVGGILEFPLTGMFGRLLPAGGSKAGQQVATAVGTGLDNLGSLCSQTGLDRWELLGLAVLSAITVYRKELSSNSVHRTGAKQQQGAGAASLRIEGEETGVTNDLDINGEHDERFSNSSVSRAAFTIPPGFQHKDGCFITLRNKRKSDPDIDNGTVSGQQPPCSQQEPTPCECLLAVAAAAAAAAASPNSLPPSAVEQRKLRRLVEGRMRSLGLPVHHLQQLRASVDKSWLLFAAAWGETLRSRHGSGAPAANKGMKEGDRDDFLTSSSVSGVGSPSPASGAFVLPPCSHRFHRTKSRTGRSAKKGTVNNSDEQGHRGAWSGDGEGGRGVLSKGGGNDDAAVRRLLPTREAEGRFVPKGEEQVLVISPGNVKRADRGNEDNDKSSSTSSCNNDDNPNNIYNKMLTAATVAPEDGAVAAPAGEGNSRSGVDTFSKVLSDHGKGDNSPADAADEDGGAAQTDTEDEDEDEECPECSLLAAAHAAAAATAASILQNGDGTVGLMDTDDSWMGSVLGTLPSDALQKALGFLEAKDLLTMAHVSAGSQEAADHDLVWREAWLARFGRLWDSGMCQEAASRWHLHGWDPRSSAVPQGWKRFFSEFEAAWLEWIAAGQNSELSCVVGLYGRLYDITEFMHRHPGSPDTLMDNAGADATEFFEDVGHSRNAHDLMTSLQSLAPHYSSLSTVPLDCRYARAGSDSSSSRAGQIWASAIRNTRITLGGVGRAARGAGGARGRGAVKRFRDQPPRDTRCVLSSTAEMMRKGRDCARVRGKALEAAATATATVEGSTAVGDGSNSEAGFWCDGCGERFDPRVQVERAGGGREGGERRSVCKHESGTLRVFYVPVRAEWGGFYSCCRKHVVLS